MSNQLIGGIPIAFDILDGFVYRYLPKGWRFPDFDFTREEETPALTVYKLHHRTLGDLGEIRLWRTSEGTSDLQFRNPPRASKRLTKEDLQLIQEQDDAERLSMMETIRKNRRTIASELDHQRQRYQKGVRVALFSRLEQHPAWIAVLEQVEQIASETGGIQSSDVSSPSDEEPIVEAAKRGAKGERLEERICAVDGWQAVAEDLYQWQYAEAVGVDVSTLRRWRRGYPMYVEKLKRKYGTDYEQHMEEERRAFNSKISKSGI